eukprot:192512-Pyramimonas_sp.AAC.1
MPRREAQRLLDNLNGEEPFKNTDDFVRAMAAITSVYWDEATCADAFLSPIAPIRSVVRRLSMPPSVA